MKKILFILISSILILMLASCENKDNNSIIETKDVINDSTNGQNNETKEEVNNYMNMNLELKIDDLIVDVDWENNESVNDLKAISNGGLNINMNKYGGFEQVGSIGKTIKSSDTRITTNPGDIVLYSSNQIVIFYGSNRWEYTKLGHINLSKEELSNILGDKNVIISLNLK